MKIIPRFSREEIPAFIRKIPSRFSQYLFLRRLKIERAKRLRLEDQFAEAEKILSDILIKQPRNVLALAEFACLERDRGEPEKAYKLWVKAMSQLQKPAEYYYNLVLQATESYDVVNKPGEAQRLINQFAPPDRFNDSNLALANLEEDQKDWLKRVNDFFAGFNLSGIRLSPGQFPSYFNLTGQDGHAISQGPKVSVIMSAFNVEKYIEVAINSILGQTWKNLELIVVDDCSSDSTTEIVARMAKMDTRIRLIINPINAGTYVCRNIALDSGTGEYITTHDSDDWAHPERVTRQVQDLLGHPSHLANMCQNVRMSENGRFELTSYGIYNHQSCVSLLLRREKAKLIVGYWDSVRVGADIEYIERIKTVLGTSAVGVLPEALLVILRRGDSLTTTSATMGLTGRVSLARRQYRKAFEKWHKSITLENCRLPFPMEERIFPAPPEITVPHSVVKQATASHYIFKSSEWAAGINIIRKSG